MFSAWFPKNKKGSCQKHCTGLKDLQATLIRENPTNTLEKTSTKYPSKKCWKLKGSSRPATWKVPWPTRTLQWYPKSRLFLSGKVFVLEICFSCLGGKQLWSLKPSTKPPHTREQRGPLKGGGRPNLSWPRFNIPRFASQSYSHRTSPDTHPTHSNRQHFELWTRPFSQVCACVRHVRRHSSPYHSEHHPYHRFAHE